MTIDLKQELKVALICRVHSTIQVLRLIDHTEWAYGYSLYGDRNRPFLVISWLENEYNELTPVITLKYIFTVLPKFSK